MSGAAVRVRASTAFIAALWAVVLTGTSTAASPAPTPAAAVQFVDTGAAAIRYDLRGRGAKTVVLVHEMGVTLEVFDAIVPELARTHRVLRYDQRGFGLSEKVRGKVTLDDGVADLEGLLNGLHIDAPVTLVGGAIGASIATRFAARHPERVAGLVLMSPVFTLRPAGGAPATPMPAAAPSPVAPTATPRVDNSPAAVIEREGVRAYLAQQMDVVYPAQLQTPSRVALFRAMQMSTDPESRIVVTRSMGAADLAADLPAIRCPTLVVSTLLFNNGGSAKSIAAAIPGAQLVELQTGHYAALESPELLLPVLKRFIDR